MKRKAIAGFRYNLAILLLFCAAAMAQNRAGDEVSGTQSERISTVVDDGKVVEGIVYSSLLHGSNAQGRHIKWLYEAKFRATIRNSEQVGSLYLQAAG